MGTHLSWLAVQLPAREISTLVAAVIASYEARGAALDARAHDASLTSTDAPRGRLGLALQPAGRDWLTIVDSTRYLADAALAEDLAEKLGVTVFRESVVDAADYHGIDRLGPPAPRPKKLAWPSSYDDPEGHARGTQYLVVGSLRAKSYGQRAPLGVRVKCKACEYRGRWTPGYDVPFAPEPSQLVTMRTARARGLRAGAAQRMLLALSCNDCRAALGWAEAELVHGLIVGVHKLDGAPSDRERYDACLASQREQVEAVLPSKGTLTARGRAQSFTSDYAQTPRATLEAALRALTPKLPKTKPELLAWSFAPTREALVAEVEKSAPTFDWKRVDLPGTIALQLVAWLGPKPNAPELEAFVKQVTGLLGPSAFARQGRNPKTLDWITCVGFELPGGTWAGLRLFDEYRRMKK